MRNKVIDNSLLMEDWNWDKNNKEGFDPNVLTCGSSKTVWWKCHICGYEWKTRIERKNNGSNCKKCLANKYATASYENSIAYLYPEVAKEWDNDKNSCGPDRVYPQSNRTYNWICIKGHPWEDTAYHRTIRGYHCPACSNHKVLPGVNDLATTHPYLLEEWDDEKNAQKNLFPSNITYGCKNKAFWKCKRGHSWECEVYRRASNNEGCPKCSRESRISFPEKAIAYYFSLLFDDLVENYRGEKIGRQELDLYIPSLNVAIEYDGARWHKKVDKDIQKDLVCKQNGILLFRVREKGCADYSSESLKYYVEPKNNEQLNKTIMEIVDVINERYHKVYSLVPNIDKDTMVILSSVVTRIKKNSIANAPYANEWDTEKNAGIDPALIPIYSNRKFWWKCSEHHSWYAQASKRAIGRGCIYCTNQKVLKGFNDLESNYPLIANEWDYPKNSKKPDEVTSKSNAKCWWVCSKCNHNWKTGIYVRTVMGCGCPKCAGVAMSNKKGRKVKNLDTNVVYNSVNKASKDTGIAIGSISACCNAKTKQAGGYRWQYI